MFFNKFQEIPIRALIGTLLLIISTETQGAITLSTTSSDNTNNNTKEVIIATVNIGRLKYEDGEVVLLQNQLKKSEFFFTPLPQVMPNLTECNNNDFSGYIEFTLVVSLYTMNLVESIERHIQKHQNICRSEHCTVSLLPLKSIRLFEKGLRTKESRIKYTLDSQWHTHAHIGQIFNFIIYSSTMSTCKTLKNLIVSRCYLSNFEIHYSLDGEQTIIRTLEVSIEHITNTLMYNQIKSQFSPNDIDTVALTNDDYKNLLGETMSQISNSLLVENGYEGIADSAEIDRLLNQRLQYKQVRLITDDDYLWHSLYWKADLTRPDRLSQGLNKVIKQDVTDPNKFHYDLVQVQKTLKPNLKFDEIEKIEKFEKYIMIRSQHINSKNDYETNIEINKRSDHTSSSTSEITNEEKITSINPTNDRIAILERNDVEKLIRYFSDYVNFQNDTVKPKPIDIILVQFDLLKSMRKLFSSVVQLKIQRNVEVLPLRCPYEYRVGHLGNDWLVGKYYNLSNIVDEFHKNFTTELNLLKTSMNVTLSKLNQSLFETLNTYKILINTFEKRLNENCIENMNNSKMLINALESRLIEKIEHNTKTINSTTDKAMNQIVRTPPVTSNIPANARWEMNGETVAGGNGLGSATNQLYYPYDLFIDNDQTMIIADYHNNRIIQWNMNDTNGKIIAGGRGEGSRLDQLHQPRNVLIDKQTDSLIICDQGNRRVIRWFRRSNIKQGEILINNVRCSGLAMDEQKYIYVSEWDKNEVRRYKIGHDNGTLAAGGNGRGTDLKQFNYPTHIFVDRQQAIYVTDQRNHRIMKWNKGAQTGILIAGGHGQGKALTQLYEPNGLFVDALGNVYVADSSNHRIIRWSKGEQQGVVIVGGNGSGKGTYQFSTPMALSFDRHNKLYVVDHHNNRIQRFSPL